MVSVARNILGVLFILEIVVLDIFLGITYGLRLKNALVVSGLFGLQSLHFWIPMTGIASIMAPTNKFAVLGAHASYILALFFDAIALVLVLAFKNVFEGEVSSWALAITISALAIDVTVLSFITGYHIEVTNNIKKYVKGALQRAGSYYNADVKFFLPTKIVFRLRRAIARAWIVSMIFYLLFFASFVFQNILDLRASFAIIPSFSVLWSFPFINVVVGPGGKSTDPEPYVRVHPSSVAFFTYFIIAIGLTGMTTTGIWMFFSYRVGMLLLTKILYSVSYGFLLICFVSQFITLMSLFRLGSALQKQMVIKSKLQ